MTIERYPDLKTTQQFQDMLASLEGTENRIALARNEYNESVQSYNSYIRRFPQLIFARLFDFGVRGYFKSEAGAERRVDIDFSGVGGAQQPQQQAQPATPAPTEEGGER